MTVARLRIFMHTGVLTLLVGLTLGLAVPRWSEARATGGFGVMGDSSSDEYRADDNRGGAYAATLNWVELLARYRGLDFGAWATRAEPRRTGYEYNWARSGARAADLIAQGQAAGLARQVAEGRVSSAVVMIGANDFSLTNNTYAEIYSGAVTGAALTAKIDGIVASIASALDIVRSAGPVQLLVVNLPALDLGPAFQASFPDPARRRLVTNAILAVNAGIANITAQRGIPVVDLDAFAIATLSGADANGNVSIRGELVNLLKGGDEPHHALLGDNYHGGTVSEGMLANYFLDHFAAAGGPIIPRFTDQDLLANAGIVSADITPPTVSIGAPLNGAVVSGPVAVTATVSDDREVLGVQFPTVRVRIQSAQRFPAYALSVELLRVTIPLSARLGRSRAR